MKKSSKANAAAGLPQFHPAHQQENLSFTRLKALLPQDKFLLRREDGGDYGVDLILEVINEGAVTNVRSHVQVKSTGARNVGGDSLKYKVELKTIRYLLNAPSSIYMVYSVTNDAFFWEWSRYIAIAAKERGVDLKGGQKTFTYEFSKTLSVEVLEHIHKKLLEDNRALRRIGTDGGVLSEYFMPRDDSPTLYSELLLLFIKGAYEAVISLSRGSEIDDPVTSNLVALSYYHTHNYREALKENARSLAKAPADKEAKRVRAMILCDKGRDEHRRELIEEAKRTMLEIQRDEWDWEDFYNYGNMASALGDCMEAVAHFEEALKISPNQAMAWNNLATCHFKEGEHEEGLRCLERALEIDDNLIEAIISKANVLREEFGNPAEAVNLLRRALALAEGEYIDNAGIYFWLAKSLSDSGNPDEALARISHHAEY